MIPNAILLGLNIVLGLIILKYWAKDQIRKYVDEINKMDAGVYLEIDKDGNIHEITDEIFW